MRSILARGAALLLLAWALGFLWFLLSLARPADAAQTDGIVVLTGAKGRIDRGIALLQAHKARRMLVSGVAPGVRPIDLALEYHAPKSLFTCCIDLGGEAVDTRSNAEETAEWVRDNEYRSIRLVTSDWHMARARMELAAALDNDVTIISDGVVSKPRPRMLRLLAEYHKLLIRRIALWLGLGS